MDEGGSEPLFVASSEGGLYQLSSRPLLNIAVYSLIMKMMVVDIYSTGPVSTIFIPYKVMYIL